MAMAGLDHRQPIWTAERPRVEGMREPYSHLDDLVGMSGIPVKAVDFTFLFLSALL
jgi:hypothetical protein